MTHMLCRNRVTGFAKWQSVFSSHADAHQAAGLTLVHLWRAMSDPNNVFFLFEVGSLDKAKAFINTPEASDAAKESGVIEGEYHFLDDSGGYHAR